MEDREEAAGSRHYGKPPWRFKGRAVYQLHLVKSRVARALIPKDLRLVQAFGYTLGGFFLANYDDSPVGAFDELVVIAGIVWNPPTSCAWASKVLVNSDEACLHGRTDVGLPSHVARFTKLQCCREQFSRSTAKTGQQESRAKLFLSKIGLQRTKPPSVKYDLKTNVTELYGDVSAEDIFSISLLSSLPADNSKAFLGPHIKMSLPSFSGRTQYHASLLKYSCQMECRSEILKRRKEMTDHVSAKQSLVYWFSNLKVFVVVLFICAWMGSNCVISTALSFNKYGEFRILQVADMHFGNGQKTKCLDVLPSQVKGCSDLNTTAFIKRMIKAERPDFIVFTGDNIFGSDVTDATKSMDMAFAPAIESGIPWAAVLGNHDQESKLKREGVMNYIVGMKNTLSMLNPVGVQKIDGFGNYNLEVAGVHGSPFENKSMLNLYFLDSGDYSKDPSISGYDWIKSSQISWFQSTSKALKSSYNVNPDQQQASAPGLVFFHIPLPEYASLSESEITGVKQEGISSPKKNSGFFDALVKAGDVRAVFVGHDHINDFCGTLKNIHLCYAGGFGYHAYGKVGWSRRARVVNVKLEMGDKEWGPVSEIKTWKRLDDAKLTTVDVQVLYGKNSRGVSVETTVANV